MKRRSIFEINEGVVQLSKCGRYIACGCKNDLQVIDSNSAEVISTLPCTHSIKHVDWHFASNHLLSVLDNVPAVEAFSLSDPEWKCRIEGGELGLETATWGPRGYYILTVAEFAVRISVWSLTGESVCYIDNPVLKEKDKFSFSEDGNYFAVISGPLERYNIVIYCTQTWSIIQVIECSRKIVVPSNPLWSPISLHLAIRETMDLKCAFLEVYSMVRTKLCGTFKKTEKFSRITKMNWVPSGQFLLAGCHNEKVYVFNYITWSVFAVLNHSMMITDENCKVYTEERKSDEFERVNQRPVSMSKVKASGKRGTLPGVTRIICDSSNDYIATQCSSMPAVVFIWEMCTFQLKTVITFHRAVVDMNWNPATSKLMICSSPQRVSVWTSGAPRHVKYSSTCNGLPFVRTCFWCPGKDNFCVVGSSFLYILYTNV